MSTQSKLLMATLWILPAVAAQNTNGTAAEPVAVSVRVLVEDPQITPAVLLGAEALAGRIFARIGIRVQWTDAALPVVSSCGPRSEQIVIRITDDNTRAPGRGSLGLALPFARDGVRVTVFSSDVRARSHRVFRLEAAILGHAMAHEMGHVLEGVDQHSGSGVMRARWTAGELNAMDIEPMSFSAFDAELIHDSIAARRAAACGPASGTSVTAGSK